MQQRDAGSLLEEQMAAAEQDQRGHFGFDKLPEDSH